VNRRQAANNSAVAAEILPETVASLLNVAPAPVDVMSP